MPPRPRARASPGSAPGSAAGAPEDGGLGLGVATATGPASPGTPRRMNPTRSVTRWSRGAARPYRVARPAQRTRPARRGRVRRASRTGPLLVAAGSADTAWALNLLADPSCVVTIAGRSFPAVAEPLDGAEHAAAVRDLVLRGGTPAEGLGSWPLVPAESPSAPPAGHGPVDDHPAEPRSAGSGSGSQPVDCAQDSRGEGPLPDDQPPPTLTTSAPSGPTKAGRSTARRRTSGHRVLAPDDAEVEAYLETALARRPRNGRWPTAPENASRAAIQRLAPRHRGRARFRQPVRAADRAAHP